MRAWRYVRAALGQKRPARVTMYVILRTRVLVLSAELARQRLGGNKNLRALGNGRPGHWDNQKRSLDVGAAPFDFPGRSHTLGYMEVTWEKETRRGLRHVQHTKRLMYPPHERTYRINPGRGRKRAAPCASTQGSARRLP